MERASDTRENAALSHRGIISFNSSILSISNSKPPGPAGRRRWDFL